jgi:hypothetical protein
MALNRSKTLLACAMTAVLAGPALAEECPRIQEGPTVASQPDAWKSAVDQLAAETARPDKPWGCVKGSVDVVVHGTGATLIVRTADGVDVSRELDGIEDLVPLGEAILAKPTPSLAAKDASPPAQAGPTLSGSAAPPKNDATSPAVSTPREDPWLVASAVASPRYAGSTNALLASAEARVTAPIKHWVPGGWVRVDGPIANFGPDADFVSLSIGASFGRVFSIGPVDLTPSLDGSAAIQFREDRPHDPGDTHVDARLGADARVAFPRKSIVRAVVTSDFELAPGQLADDRPPPPKNGDAPRTDLPSYTIGLGIGIEIAPR